MYSPVECDEYLMRAEVLAFLLLVPLTKGELIVIRWFLRYLLFRLAMRFAGRLAFLVFFGAPLVWQGVQHQANAWLHFAHPSQNHQVGSIPK